MRGEKKAEGLELRKVRALESIAESLAKTVAMQEQLMQPIQVVTNGEGEAIIQMPLLARGDLYDADSFPLRVRVIPEEAKSDEEPLSPEDQAIADSIFGAVPDGIGFAQDYQLQRHSEKQGVSWADAWRHFEREGYDMSQVDGQYAHVEPMGENDV